MIHLADPWALALLLLIPLLWLGENGEPLFLRAKSQSGFGTRRTILFAAPISLAALLPLSRIRMRAVILNVVRTGCVASLVIALARPQFESHFIEAEENGRDIMLALDLSGSMRALDFIVNGKRIDRLNALKLVVKDFIRARKGDRMGLVVFGSEVYTQCPLTSDTGVLQDFVANLEVGMVGDGTALGDALAVAVKRLKDIHSNSRVIVLVTDGVKTAGSLEPIAAAEIAKREGIKVYTIGIGSDKPAPYPVTGMFGEQRIEYIPVDLDEKTLKTIADTTGGQYFRGQELEKLSAVYQEISKLEERAELTVNSLEYEDYYFPFVMAALFLLIAHELLSRTTYEVLP